MGSVGLTKKSRKNGFALIEVLVALLIASMAFAIALGSMAHLFDSVSNLKQKMIAAVEERNEYVEKREIFFTEQE